MGDTAWGGGGTLSVDGKQVAQGKIERTIPVRFSLDETMDVGMDTGTPVVEDYVDKMPFKFTGTLAKVTVDLKEGELTPTGRPEQKPKSSQLNGRQQASVPTAENEREQYQLLLQRIALED